MPQSVESGRAGSKRGFENPDQIGSALGAKRVNSKSNEFVWNGRRIVIKTGPSAIVTRPTLKRVDAIVFGMQDGDRWELYEIGPKEFEELSVRSRSKKHTVAYRLVTAKLIQEHGKPVEWEGFSELARPEGLEPASSTERLGGRITHDPAVMGGKPCIRGMRVTVGMILGLVASGHSRDRILAAYPYLEASDIEASLQYAAWRTQETEEPLEHVKCPSVSSST